MLTYSERGSGRPVLLLHGGAGPASVTGYAERLAGERPVRVITPTHPGFEGTARPSELADVAGLARVYAGFLEELGLEDVVVVGNSIGGWITAEIGLLASPRVTRLVIVDGVGIEVEGHPVRGAGLTPPELAALSFYDPETVRPAPSPHLRANLATLAVYAGDMTDPTLLGRLAGITTPTTVIWGEADGIADADYGRAYAKAIPGADFHLLAKTGHLPQIESPSLLTPLLGV